jgi:hypothetical protein
MPGCSRAAIVQALYDKSIDQDQAHSYLCATSHFHAVLLTQPAPQATVLSRLTRSTRAFCARPGLTQPGF